jgi:PH domain associated with Beige/BEACH
MILPFQTVRATHTAEASFSSLACCSSFKLDLNDPGKYPVTSLTLPCTLHCYKQHTSTYYRVVFKALHDVRELSGESPTISTSAIGASPVSQLPQKGQVYSWHCDQLLQCAHRRYLLQHTTVELYWAGAHDVFLAFQQGAHRASFCSVLRKQVSATAWSSCSKYQCMVTVLLLSL